MAGSLSDNLARLLTFVVTAPRDPMQDFLNLFPRRLSQPGRPVSKRTVAQDRRAAAKRRARRRAKRLGHA